VRLHPFRLVEPDSLAGAIDALGRLDGDARVVAGGTALVACAPWRRRRTVVIRSAG